MMIPPPEVAAAFGAVAGRLRRLPGGQERTWTDDFIVLKPADDLVEHAWVCDVFASWPVDVGVRVPEVVRASTGAWVYGGWAAHRFVDGTNASMRNDADVIRAASEAFHAQTSRLERPDFLDLRTDAWSQGDRVAWEDADAEGGAPTLEQIARLRAAFVPVDAGSQVIHGDIGGNVLVGDDGATVIDWPPYYRAVGFALAVAVADAVRWEGLPVSFVYAWDDVPQWYQLLARALVYRLATAGVQQVRGLVSLASGDHAAASEPAVALVLDRLSA